MAVLWACFRAGNRAGTAAADRGAWRFAHRRAWASGQCGLSGTACGRAQGQGHCRRRSWMPASPATPPPTGSPGSTGRCRTAPTASSWRWAPTTCCAGSTRRRPEPRSTASCAGSRAANSGAAGGHAGGAELWRGFRQARSKPIYPELAAKYDALLTRSFLDGVAGDLKLNQRDGIHPSAAGVERMVARHPAEGGGAGRAASGRGRQP